MITPTTCLLRPIPGVWQKGLLFVFLSPALSLHFR
ncbi:hypothetical protein M5D96_001347, partial [Drosophila gunungcola]